MDKKIGSERLNSCKSSVIKKNEWRDPLPEELNTLEFKAVWDCIKKWDIGLPWDVTCDGNLLYSSATGNHVVAILDALRETYPVMDKLECCKTCTECGYVESPPANFCSLCGNNNLEEIHVKKIKEEMTDKERNIQELNLEECKELIKNLLDIDVGTYPKSVVGGNNPYKKRNKSQKGWNKAVMERAFEENEILRKFKIIDW